MKILPVLSLRLETSRILQLIDGCIREDRECQRMVYTEFYAYGLSITRRYCSTPEEAKELVNDGFMKIFQRASQYQRDTSFKAWMRRVMINTCIDHYRKESKHYHLTEIEAEVNRLFPQVNVEDELAYKDIARLITLLSPMYRMVFNLYVIEGYTHEEISAALQISIGTSKSNLSKARERLREMLLKLNVSVYDESVG